MISPLSLEPLLLALREAGLPVGVAEIDRLRQVFALQPDIAGDEPDQTRRRLKVWLRALLVKSPQDRATFERIYDRWLARAEQDLQFRTLPESPPALSSLPSPRPQLPIPEHDRRGWQAAAAILALVTILVIAWLYPPKPPVSQPVPQPPVVEEQPPLPPPPNTPAEIRKRNFSSPVATLTVGPSQATWTGWLPLGLGGLALRRHLRLAISPWALRALRAEAPGPADRLQWSDARRVDLLNWLREAEAQVAASGVAPDSLLDRALRFWEGIYQQELNRERSDWKDTPAHQQLRMEHNLVLLWRQSRTAMASVRLPPFIKGGRGGFRAGSGPEIPPNPPFWHWFSMISAITV